MAMPTDAARETTTRRRFPRINDPRSADNRWLADRTRGPMDPGSVLVHAPSAAFQAPGGGENQLLRTARHLEALGLTARPFVPWLDRLERARLVHLFGMSPEGLALAGVARSMGIPVVLSTICWVEPRAIAAQAPDFPRRVLARAKWEAKAFVPSWPCWRRSLLGMADAILPNSEAEARQLVRLFGAEPDRVRVVPNGVEARFAHAEPGAFRARVPEAPRDFVLYAGRVEPRKNVLGLVRAAKIAGLPLVVIGDVVPGHEGYDARCRDEGRGGLVRVPGIRHDDPALASAYAACRVFALPSWFETPGLSALEAALAGRPIVITPFGSTREYFEGQVRYTHPDRPGMIARALAGAWDSGPDPGLADRVRRRFLWPEVARRTAEVYDLVAG